MKILLFGPSSSLGQSYIKAANRRSHTVHSITNQFEDTKTKDHSHWIRIDFNNSDSVQQLIFAEWPDVIVNCLDINDPSDEKEMVHVNVSLPKLLAQISHHLNSRFIHISNTLIFDGSNSAPYRSTDKPSPKCFYGQTKLLGEKEVLNNNSVDPLILRIPELLGHSLNLKPQEKTYNERILETLQSPQKIVASKNHYLQPTTSNNVADLLVELSERRDLHGIFHWAGSQKIDEFNLVQMILNNAGIKDPLDQIEILSDTCEQHYSMELEPLIGKVKTKALDIHALFEDLNYVEPLRID